MLLYGHNYFVIYMRPLVVFPFINIAAVQIG